MKFDSELDAWQTAIAIHVKDADQTLTKHLFFDDDDNNSLQLDTISFTL